MKRIFSGLLAALLLCTALTGCSAKNEDDWSYIKNKGTLVIGVTVYEPLNYMDENGEAAAYGSAAEVLAL